jgi:PAS domain S-box-containing protein
LANLLSRLAFLFTGRLPGPARAPETALARLHAAMDVMPEGLAFYDADDRAVIWNARYQELNTEGGGFIDTGATFRELLQIGLREGHYLEAIGCEDEWLEQRMALHTAERSTHEQPLADGRWFRVEERRTADGGILSVCEDITEIKRREATLRMMFQHNPIPMWIVDEASMRFLDVNAAAIAHYGYSREEFLSLRVIDLYAEEEHEQFRLTRPKILEAGAYHGARTWRQRKADGSEIHCLPYIQLIQYEGVAAVMSAQLDVTVRKNAEAAMALARDEAEAANRAKTEFLSNMSHEIRTPLNGVAGVAQVLASTPLSDQQREMVEVIEESARTLERLLSDLLELANVDAGRAEVRVEAFDLEATVRAAAAEPQLHAQEKSLAFTLDLAPEAFGEVQGDSHRLKQILSNLLDNAVKFTDEGEVALRVSLDPAASPALTRFEVRDTGVGFEPSAKERLFSRFEQEDGSATRKFGGTGLGLALSRELATLMGGRLEAHSEPGQGAVFTLELPLARAAAAVPTPACVPRSSASGLSECAQNGACGLRILLADDHPTNRLVVELMLASLGCDLTSVENGQEAVDAVLANRYDVILMDMQMPVMDGLAAIREIRRYEAEAGLAPTPIFTLSANAMPQHLQASIDAGADRHLTKPIIAPVLVQAIDDICQLKLGRAAA